jgi:hypothetical protein
VRARAGRRQAGGCAWPRPELTCPAPACHIPPTGALALAPAQRADVYSALASALAPSIWELDDVKKGILCQLFAGTSVTLAPEEAGGARFRGDLNVLLVGDPGTSKSQLLQYVHKVAPRGVFTSGKGSSAVGLTAYVTKDPESGSFVLESGALVLSDRGVCCIDEFDKMSEGARSVLHEAMEQQTVRAGRRPGGGGRDRQRRAHAPSSRESARVRCWRPRARGLPLTPPPPSLHTPHAPVAWLCAALRSRSRRRALSARSTRALRSSRLRTLASLATTRRCR